MSLDLATASVALAQARLRLDTLDRILTARLDDPGARQMLAIVDVVRPMLAALEFIIPR